VVEEAAVRVRHEVALDALADAAGVAVADDELSVAVALRARRMGMTAEQFTGWLDEHGTVELFRGDLRRAKAFGVLVRAGEGSGDR